MFGLARFRLKELAEYDNPVPAVVVAPDVTSPPYTASPPSERVGRWNVFEMVDEAVEKKPLRPRTVVVEL